MTSAVGNLVYATDEDPLGSADLIRWMQALNGIRYSVFLVAIGAYVLLWLRGHQRP